MRNTGNPKHFSSGKTTSSKLTEVLESIQERNRMSTEEVQEVNQIHDDAVQLNQEADLLEIQTEITTQQRYRTLKQYQSELQGFEKAIVHFEKK